MESKTNIEKATEAWNQILDHIQKCEVCGDMIRSSTTCSTLMELSAVYSAHARLATVEEGLVQSK